MLGFAYQNKNIEKIKYCSKCKRIKSLHRKEYCVCAKKSEELKG